jgi:hypothetical protein
MADPSPTQDRTAQNMRFVIEPTIRGYWTACEKRGLIEGVFATQREALRFALRHARPRSAHDKSARQKVR